jgi:hypothetical protein
LNDELLQGPDLTNNLLGILFRFRKENIAICCDIEKMFFQFKVEPQHRDLLSFLWWPNGDTTKKPQQYRMTVHLFRAVSSPAVANFGLLRAADEGEELFGKAAADFVRHNFYVDDGLIATERVEDGQSLVQNTIQLLAKRGLHLHKFVSNIPEVLEMIPNLSCEKESVSLNPDQRALGLEWNIKEDCFQFLSSVKEGPTTRRGILSAVYSLYDPLGLLSPVTLTGRQILQDICQTGSDWDDPLPQGLVDRYQHWKESLQKLKEIKVPRCFNPSDFGKVSKYELHTFSDASTEGYG